MMNQESAPVSQRAKTILSTVLGKVTTILLRICGIGWCLSFILGGTLLLVSICLATIT